ncbi:hypothetical protein TNCV_4050421 [Trichonephila clavipes]|nr:hypothetical protein TNCV_4050421 [Trichonephila clavipes]
MHCEVSESAPTTATKKGNCCLLEVEQTPLNVSAENLFERENVEEPPPNPCSESQIKQTQGTRVSTSREKKVDSSHEDFYESMQKCLGAVGKKTVNETFAVFIASELDNLPCPKQQFVTNYTIHSLIV